MNRRIAKASAFGLLGSLFLFSLAGIASCVLLFFFPYSLPFSLPAVLVLGTKASAVVTGLFSLFATMFGASIIAASVKSCITPPCPFEFESSTKNILETENIERNCSRQTDSVEYKASKKITYMFILNKVLPYSAAMKVYEWTGKKMSWSDDEGFSTDSELGIDDECYTPRI